MQVLPVSTLVLLAVALTDRLTIFSQNKASKRDQYINEKLN